MTIDSKEVYKEIMALKERIFKIPIALEKSIEELCKADGTSEYIIVTGSIRTTVRVFSDCLFIYIVKDDKQIATHCYANGSVKKHLDNIVREIEDIIGVSTVEYIRFNMRESKEVKELHEITNDNKEEMFEKARSQLTKLSKDEFIAHYNTFCYTMALLGEDRSFASETSSLFMPCWCNDQSVNINYCPNLDCEKFTNKQGMRVWYEIQKACSNMRRQWVYEYLSVLQSVAVVRGLKSRNIGYIREKGTDIILSWIDPQ